MKSIIDRLRHETTTGLCIREIDSLRGWAILGVLTYHVWYLNGKPRIDLGIGGVTVPVDAPFSVGHAGVDLFFFISGFLLFIKWGNSYILNKPRPDKLSYIKRRALRIIPAYYVMLMIYAVIFSDKGYLAGDGKWDIISHALFIHNLLPERFYSISIVFWTLGVEVQYYVILPFIAYWFVGKRSVIALPLFIIAVVCYRAYMYHLFAPKVQYMFWTMEQLPGRLDQFAIGMTAANIWLYMSASEGWKLFKYKTAAGNVMAVAGGLAAFGLLWLMYASYETYFWLGPPYLALYWRTCFGLSIAILVLGVLNAGRTRILLCNPVMEFVGIISYSVFLCHVILTSSIVNSQRLSAMTVSGKFFWTLILSLAVSMAYGIVSYLAVEKPFLSIRIAKKSTAPQ